MRKHFILFVLFALFSQFSASRTFAQTITGPTSLFAGSTGSFTLYDDVVLTNPNWSVDNGVLLSETHSGLNHSASIRFDCPGTSTVTLRDGSTVLYTLPLVTVTCRSVTTPSTTFTYVTGCGTGSITRNTSPTGDTWYWQTDPNGTSTSLGSGATLNITSSGTYYLRALKNATVPCCWSPTSLATIYVDIAPPTVTASAQTICSGQSTSIAITGTAGATFAWTVTPTNVSGATAGSGTSISQVLTATSNTTGTAVYRITPTKGSCNGTPLNVTASVKPLPTVSAADQGIFSGQSTNIAITNPNNVSGTSFAWTVNQTNVTGGTSGTGSTIAQTLSGSGTASYVITPSAGGCSGLPVISVVTLHANPTITSSSPRISVGKVTLDGGSGFATYSWKNASNQIVSTSQTYATSTPGNYSLTVTKASVLGSANASISLQGQFDGLNMNYLVSNSFMTSVTNESAIPDLPIESRSQTIQYVDGLGRPIQSVTTQGSPTKQDIVQPIVYDDFGREVRKYLPVTNGNDGFYKTNLLDASGNYVPTTYANALSKVAVDSKPYSESVLEPSPLGRVLEQGAPGTAWQPDANNSYTSTDRTIKKAYELNLANEVLLWTYAKSSASYPFGKVNAGTAASPVYYPANQLSKTRTKDEEMNEVIEFTDKSGQVVLKKVQAGAGLYASTYYIYDDLGQLVCVVPPEATARLATEYYHAAATDATKESFLVRWAFRYRYDHRRRMILKAVPGADSVRMVYDHRDRLVLTQDGNQRAGATNTIKYWTFTKYDELNRPILTGIKDTTTTVQLTQAQMQAVVNAYYANMNTTTWRKWGETYVGSAAGNVHGYTNRSYPVRTGSTTTEVDANKYLTATYYDNYSFRSTWLGSYTYVDENLSEASNGYTYDQPDVENLRVIGQVTGTKIKVLDGDIGTTKSGGFTWLKSISYYDDKYRVIQTIADNYKGGNDRMTNVIDFAGKVLESKLTHIEADVAWQNRTQVRVEGNKLVSTASGAGASSSQQLLAGQNGWMEVVVTETTATSAKWIGLSDSDPNTASSSIGYALYMAATNLIIHENGTYKGQVYTGLKAGDILGVERVGTSVRYKVNGSIVYTSATASSGILMVDATLNNGTIVDVRASFATTTRTTLRRFEYDHAGRLLKTWHKLDSQPEVLLALNEYNELGQLVDKKLHSTLSDGSNAKQSVDYRYNIRGWLTHINNAQVSTQAANNDDTNDLFGMELLYNETDANLSNTALYNGNISATKWSSALGLGTVKEKGYTYSYDQLNRIKTSVFKEKGTTWTTPANSGFQETGFNYDLNGNITTQQRNDKRATGWMDNLAYAYTGNQLMRVTDTGDDYAGFMDGQPGTGNDYTYDANGNMTRDLNKGIGATLTDATSLIVYNYLNLPETITKGINSVRYIYDASGRKLAQTITFGTRMKTTDYAGEFVYEDDALQFINHEEGRIVTAANQTLITHDGTAVTGITAVTSTLAPVTQNSDQKYIRATAVGTTTKQGMFPIGGTLAVTAGERYLIRAKGYRTSTSSNQVHLYIRTNGTDLNWPGAQLPRGTASATNESYVEQIITVPAGHTTLQAGVVWNSVAAGEQFFLNDFEITKLTTNATPEYQYHLKDHLGNVRLTFTSKVEAIPETATLEDANSATEQSQFLRYANAKRVKATILDRTNGASIGYAERLNGGTNEIYGLAKSLSVMPGDVINIEVYAKYIDPNSSNWTGTLSTLMSQIASNTAGVVFDGGSYSSSTSSFNASYPGLLGTKTDNGAPKAYLNWLVFDRNYVSLTGGFKQITTAGKEAGSDVAHELVTSPTITITDAGFVYIWLSNENTTPVEVYFDDFKVMQTKSPVVATNDYYAFGLTFNSYNRENSTQQNYLYNGKEVQDELNIGWLDYGARLYQPEIARWNGIDKSSENYFNQSPYHYAGNNPIILVDFDGNDYGVSVNQNARSITIQAHFITNSANAPAFNSQGRDKWNAQSGRNVFVTGSVKELKQRLRSGQDAGVYTINIKITSEVDDGPGADGLSAGDVRTNTDQTGTVNSFDTAEKFPRNERQVGGTGDDEVTVVESAKNSGTTTHETSHAMGNAHTKEGGTLDINGGTTVTKNNVAETLKGVGIGGNTVQRNAKGSVGDGTLLNGSSNQGLERGKVISQARYNRIVRRIERREKRKNQN